MNQEHLRTQAVERLGSDSDADPIVHDLGVHQIELEIQNEELRDAYDRLEQTTQEYTDLFEKAPMGLVVIDEYGIIRRCNTVFQQLLGPKNVILNHALADFVTPDSARAWRGRFRAFFPHPEEKRIDLETLTSANRRQIVRFVGRSVDFHLSGTGPSLMLVAIDVTAEIEAGRRIQAMSTVNDSLSMVGRDSAIDIAVVLGDLVQSISNAHEGASEVRLVSRLQSVRAPSGSASVVGLIAHELVNNAYKYAFRENHDTSSGPAAVIELELQPTDEGRARLEVRDNGVGFAGVSANDDVPRSGLGLSLVEG